MINYYARVAPALLPQLAGRPVTFIRHPDGVDGESWFEKNVPLGAPPWLRTVQLPSTGSGSGRGPGTISHPLLDDLPSLVWAATMAALELHTPQWTIGADRQQCCRVAGRLCEILTSDGLIPFAKTSGSKGMQLYCGITTDHADAPAAYAKQLAQQLAQETPDTVTAVMAKAQRTGKVFIDWSLNSPTKTTIAAYSLRGRDTPTASTPITWDEVRACRTSAELTFTADDVLHRIDEHGDLHDTRVALPGR